MKRQGTVYLKMKTLSGNPIHTGCLDKGMSAKTHGLEIVVVSQDENNVGFREFINGCFRLTSPQGQGG